MFNFFKNRKRGFSLIEMIIYLAILSVILILIVNVIISLLHSQSSIKASKAIEETYISSFDRMVREIRDSVGVHGDTTFGINVVNSGSLKLNSVTSAGVPRTVEFYVSQGVLMMRENSTVLGPIMPGSATLTSLIFRSIDSGPTNAIRIEMTVQSGTGSALKTSNLTTTAILRGSY
jgi:prepilin-type N-terminal cleavage/methylation domain-containing protein